MKKRPKLQVTSPAFEADFDITLAPLNSDLGPDGVKEAIFNSEWKKLVSNVNTLSELVMGAKEMVKKLSTGTKEELVVVSLLRAIFDFLSAGTTHTECMIHRAELPQATSFTNT